VTVPEAAVLRRDGQAHVFEVVDDRLRLTRITVGGTQQGQIVVKEGLRGGETVVTSPAPTLKDGDKVRATS